MAQAHALDPAGVVEAVIDGARAGQAATGVKVTLAGIISRTYGPEAGTRELEAILAGRDGITALDLAGDEQKFPAALFISHYRRARDAGLRLTVHAGEADGPASVWSAIDDLGAERIGHGIRSVEDPWLMDVLAERGIGLEVCLTSNIHTSCVADYASHPARRILQHGLLMNLNTDDPGISDIDLRYEYEQAAPAAGLDPAMIRQAQHNALTMAFIDETDRERLRRATAARHRQDGEGPADAG